jgi:hypothetical protein
MSDTAFDFKSLADTARDALLAEPFFANIPAFGGAVVVSLDSGDIENTITQDLNKIGLNVTISTNEGFVGHPNQSGPYFDDLGLVAIITEDVTVNRAASTNGGNNPTAYAVAAAVCAILHKLATEGVSELFLITRIARVLTPPDGQNVWNVFFKTQAGLSYTRPALAPVVVDVTAPGNQTINLSCATPGAAIFYTLNGAYPAPRTGILSTGPINITAGQKLWARAWLPGYAPSNPLETLVQY